MVYLMILLEALGLVIALAIDEMICSFSYGANKIKIPMRSMLTINAIDTALLGIGLLFGTLVGQLIPLALTATLSFFILFFLGLSKVFDSAIKKIIRKKNGINKNFNFSLFNLGFILTVYANPEKADADESKVLSPKEAVPLALALGLDGLSVGFGVGIAAIHFGAIMLMSFLVGMFMLILGSWLGNKIAKSLSLDFGWLSGLLLILIAISGII